MAIKRPHILIVDDEVHNLEIISEVLQDEDFTLTEANNGATAWKILEQAPELYDVILLDRMMPGIDGLEVLEKIKRHEILKYCPVILQTAKSDKTDIIEGIKAGAYYYLTKPFDDQMLLSIVRSAVEERSHYLSMMIMLDENNKSLGLMNVAQFRFRDIDEAQRLSSLLAKACPQPEQIINGLSELMINAIEHGNLGITYDEKSTLLEQDGLQTEIRQRLSDDKYKHKYANVDFQRSEEKLEIFITDQGEGFNWKKYISFDPERATHSHGRGIAMANYTTFAEVEYQGKGNIVKVTIPLFETV